VTKGVLDDKLRSLRHFLLVTHLDPAEIPGRLKAARTDCGRKMTQKVVSDLIGVHKRTVENDEDHPSDGIWERLNDYAGIYRKPVEQLLWGDVELIDASRLESLEATVVRQGKAMTEALGGATERLAKIEQLLTPPAAQASRKKRATGRTR
jgi:hypothetical protein